MRLDTKGLGKLYIVALAAFAAALAAFFLGLVVFCAALFVVPNTAWNPGHMAAVFSFPVLFLAALLACRRPK